MADVFDVAEFFIQVANQSEDDQMTNLKLNKLLYYAQGAYLARTGKPLFENRIEAWDLGPVVPEVYHKYKVCGKNPIASEGDSVNLSSFEEEEREVLFDVMRDFGQYTGARLVNLTHQPDAPWSKAKEAGEKLIARETIRAYFLMNPVKRFGEKLKPPAVDALPADWYDPDEDAEWEAYL